MSVKEAIAEYIAPEIEISEPAILLTVYRLYKRNMSEDDLYGMSAWELDRRRAQE